MQKLRVLILEDDLKTLSIILDKLVQIEQQRQIPIATTVLTESHQVEEYVNQKEADYFDLILLDCDCKDYGTFHVLDFEKFDTDKIISISSVPGHNRRAQQKGVKHVVLKDYYRLDKFADQLHREINHVI